MVFKNLRKRLSLPLLFYQQKSLTHKTFIFISAICLINPIVSLAQINKQDSLALVDLYNSTNGSQWSENAYWLTAAPVSIWEGVTVVNSRVTKIILSGFDNFSDLYLSGTLPSSLGNLTNLRTLNLSDNRLTGNIPSTLGNLSNLQHLELGVNSLTGNIPSTLGNLVKLRDLGLGYNQLTGSIPSTLGNLSNLDTLDLGNNQLIGSIPSTLGNLGKLQDLGLGYNQLSGSIPSTLGNMSKLQDLGLVYNQLSGSIPSTLSNLTNLQTLGLANNQLSGSIPSTLSNLSNLQDLSFDNNQLIGSIPSTLSNLSNLQTLGLANNQLSGSIPYIGNLTNLITLDLSQNQLTGSIPSELRNLSNLQALGLASNQLSGSIPSSLGNLSNLLYLDLNQNQLTGNIPSELGNLSNLKDLSLNNNQLSGSISSTLASFGSDLRNISLDYNQLSGNIPQELAYPNRLENLGLSYNLLSGKIPSSLGNPRSIFNLGLNNNQLTFDGMEAVAQRSGYWDVYAPQANIPLNFKYDLLSVSVGGTLANDTFHWYKNGMLYKTIVGDSTLTISSGSNYYVVVTNSIATKLTLYSDTVMSVLPVTFINFGGVIQNDEALLRWSTSSEINNKGFEVQRSNTSERFSDIGFVTNNENYSSLNDYTYTDNKIVSGLNYYRLKQIDLDGRFSYSSVIRLEFSKFDWEIMGNPATNNSWVQLLLDRRANVSFYIISLYGQVVQNIQKGTLQKGTYSIPLNLSNVSSGMYIVRLIINNQGYSKKIIK